MLYNLVVSAKYRRAIFDSTVDKVIQEVYLEIEQGYQVGCQVKFLEVGTNKNHVLFLVQAVPRYSVPKVGTINKSLTAREIFRRAPRVNEQVWGWKIMLRRV
ncbi:MAG: hypothetical protein NPIRA06_29690 [Nitrospirales bacterium]|nr:MAG: hypothetical protein NPIRA06_29690 [Nitrospirales bacterium]